MPPFIFEWPLLIFTLGALIYTLICRANENIQPHFIKNTSKRSQITRFWIMCLPMYGIVFTLFPLIRLSLGVPYKLDCLFFVVYAWAVLPLLEQRLEDYLTKRMILRYNNELSALSREASELTDEWKRFIERMKLVYNRGFQSKVLEHEFLKLFQESLEYIKSVANSTAQYTSSEHINIIEQFIIRLNDIEKRALG